MPKPLLIIVNGPPGVGKTTLAKRLAADLTLPVIHRDSVAETIFDALESQTNGRPVMIGPASFTMMHYFAGLLLAANQSLIVEGCFYNTALATSEFLRLKQVYDFEPLQVQCKADGAVLLERFLARAGTPERHSYHRDLEFAENHKEIILQGRFADLAIGGQVLEIDTTDIANLNYTELLLKFRPACWEAALFCRYILSSLDRLLQCLKGLSDEQLNWRPPAPNTNSLSALTIHTLGNAQENLLYTLCDKPDPYNREQEFQAKGQTKDELMVLWQDLREHLQHTLLNLSTECLTQTHVHPRRGPITGLDIVIVVARHCAEHLGQAELTRDLLLATTTYEKR